MKKIVLFAVMALVSFAVLCQTDAYKSKSKSTIIAENFVKQKLKYPKEVDFHGGVVHEENGYGKCIVLEKFTAKNSFGVKTEYVYKIWLSHNGKEWTEQTNWTYEKLIIENTQTGEQTVYDNREKPKNDTVLRNIGSIDGIKCTIVESNDSFTKIITEKKLTKEQLKKVPSKFKIKTATILFHLPNKQKRGEEYASIIGTNLYIFGKKSIIEKIDR